MALTTTTTFDPMCVVAAHEAGHAFSMMMAHLALGYDYASFRRVFIRRDFSSPYIDRNGRQVDDCAGMCEGPDLYAASANLGIIYQQPESGAMPATLARMEWAILTSLAGPFAEAAARGVRSKASMRWKALFDCGSIHDYRTAGAVLQDYKKASGRHRGLPYFEDQTRDLVLEGWPAIEALAQALLTRETLDHDDAYAIVEPFLEPPCDVSFATPAGWF
jgi:hypothetical protein